MTSAYGLLTPDHILKHVAKEGIMISTDGTKLFLSPKAKVTTELADVIRKNKFPLMAMLLAARIDRGFDILQDLEERRKMHTPEYWEKFQLYQNLLSSYENACRKALEFGRVL